MSHDKEPKGRQYYYCLKASVEQPSGFHITKEPLIEFIKHYEEIIEDFKSALTSMRDPCEECPGQQGHQHDCGDKHKCRTKIEDEEFREKYEYLWEK